jgi:hypothetical protein
MTNSQTQEIEVRLIRPHPGQRRVLNAPERFVVVCCGRRWGKSALARRVLSVAALNGQRVAYFGPSAKQQRSFWNEIRETLRPAASQISEVDRTIHLVTGGILRCWSAEDRSPALGEKYHLVVIDEAAVMRDPDLWQRNIRPTLTDYRGRAYFFSTPRGLNWFHDLYQRGIDPTITDWASFSAPTADNPYIPRDEIVEARRSLPDRIFRSEYLAEFVTDGYGVFRNVQTVSTLTSTGYIPGHVYVAGVDWGRSGDYTVVSVIDATTSQQVFIDRFTDTAFSLQQGRIKNVSDRYRLSVIYAEANSLGGPNVEALIASGLPVIPFNTTAQSKGPLIEGLALALEQGAIELLNDPVQVGELQSYDFARLPSGGYRYSAPAGMHDDSVIALALAWHATGSARPVIIEIG